MFCRLFAIADPLSPPPPRDLRRAPAGHGPPPRGDNDRQGVRARPPAPAREATRHPRAARHLFVYVDALTVLPWVGVRDFDPAGLTPSLPAETTDVWTTTGEKKMFAVCWPFSTRIWSAIASVVEHKTTAPQWGPLSLETGAQPVAMSSNGRRRAREPSKPPWVHGPMRCVLMATRS